MLLLSSLCWSLLCAVLCFAVRVLLGQDSEVVQSCLCVRCLGTASMKNGNPKEELETPTKKYVLRSETTVSISIGVFYLAWDIPRAARKLPDLP